MNKRLLILHGWGSNSQRWQRVKELLEEKGMEVLILDLPGFGITSDPEKPWGRKDYLNWILERLKEKNWQKFNLLGHSFGGGLATKMAVDFPEKIEKLILVSPSIIKRKKIKTLLFSRLTFFGKKIFSLPGLKKLQSQAQWLIYKLAGVSDYYLASEIMKETMRKIAKEENLEMILEKIKAPTLILWGKKDNVLPVKDAYRVKEKIKGSVVKIIPNVRHSPHRESPEELTENIINFLI